MEITVDISMYPLAEDYKPAIKAFIRSLRSCEGLTLVTNQLSTQVVGEFDTVTRAINDCMRDAMADGPRVVFVARFLSAGLPIERLPNV